VNDFSREIAREVLLASREGPGVIVATVIAAPEDASSAPGSKLLVRRDGGTLGSFGGAAFETTVIEDALNAIGEFPRRPVQALYYRSEGPRIHWPPFSPAKIASPPRSNLTASVSRLPLSTVPHIQSSPASARRCAKRCSDSKWTA
jgi:hypothetical protein